MTDSPRPDSPLEPGPSALLLPGMTLNRTTFPDLGIPTVAPDFNRLVLGPEGASVRIVERRMSLYADLIDDLVGGSPLWPGRRRLVVGHSFGGMLALTWLLERSQAAERIDGLLLIASTAGPMYERVRMRIGGAGGRGFRIGADRWIKWWNRPGVTRGVKRLLGDAGEAPYDFRSAPIRSDLALDLAGWRNTDWRSMRSYRIAMEGFDVRQRLGELRVPTVVLHGTRDSLFPVEVARDLALGIPNSELRLVDGAGHALPLTHGDAVVRAVRDLLAP